MVINTDIAAQKTAAMLAESSARQSRSVGRTSAGSRSAPLGNDVIDLASTKGPIDASDSTIEDEVMADRRTDTARLDILTRSSTTMLAQANVGRDALRRLFAA